ncbi:MAG: rod shape-determining protein RodA [Paracoccaceae bacterium]
MKKTVVSFSSLIPIGFWRSTSILGYLFGLSLLVYVELFGQVGMGVQRWIELGGFRLQPSELMKITIVVLLAAYYEWLPPTKTSHPFWVILPVVLILIPVGLVFKQPDLGTGLLILMAGGIVMFVAGVHWGYFAGVATLAISAIIAIFQTRGTDYQFLKDYQYRRIDTFLDPANDPLGAGYHITQSQIALGSGGWSGRGFMQGTQSRLNFLPEKHTDFIFTTLAEEFGMMGGLVMLFLYGLILVFCLIAAMQTTDRFSALLIKGISINFFLYYAINMAMVMGMAPVVGVPLPLVSYGGSAMLVLLGGFGLIQSAHIHRPR